MLPRSVSQSTIFGEIAGEKALSPPMSPTEQGAIDLDNLRAAFTQSSRSNSKKAIPVSPKGPKLVLCDARRSQQVSILMHRAALEPSMLEHCLNTLQLHDGVTQETVELVAQLFATNARAFEAEATSCHSVSVDAAAALTPAEQFLWQMHRIPKLRTKLTVLLSSLQHSAVVSECDSVRHLSYFIALI